MGKNLWSFGLLQCVMLIILSSTLSHAQENFVQLDGLLIGSEWNSKEFSLPNDQSYVLKIEGVPIDKIESVFLKNKDIKYKVSPFHENEDTEFYISNLMIFDASLDNVSARIVMKESHYNPKVMLYSRRMDTKNLNLLGKYLQTERFDSCFSAIPNYISREEWGSSFNLTEDIYRGTAVYTDVTHLIIHHSATSNTSSNWASVVSAIFDFHVNVNGWDDIGYNWLIDPNGVLYEGRGGGDNVRGAHMCGKNNNSMAVCILGDFTAVPPTREALQTLTRLLSWKSCLEMIDPLGTSPIDSYYGVMNTISGHRDGCAPAYTECPGNRLYELLNDIRDTTFIIVLNGTISSDKNINANSIKLYPNPTYGSINIENIGKRIHTIFVTDVLNRVVLTAIPIDENELEIDISSLPSGMYFIGINAQRMAFIKL